MSHVRTVLSFGFIACVLLSLEAAIPAFKHQGIMSGIFTWAITSTLSLSGPIASYIFGIPFFTYIPLGFIYITTIASTLLIVFGLHIKNRKRSATIQRIVVFVWVAIGSYFSVIGVLSSI
jgi:hypothetical protein